MPHPPRLTLRTLLAYIDDTLEPDQARALGQKVAESDEAKVVVERIKKVTRRRGLAAPAFTGDEDDVSDPNTVAQYLSDTLSGDQLRELEETCLDSDVHLAEVAACHQILTLVLTEPVRVPPSANQRMYKLVEPPASDPNRRPGKGAPIGGVAPPLPEHAEGEDPDTALLLGMKRYSASDTWAGRIGLVAAAGAVAAFLAIAVLMALPRSQPDGPDTSPNSVHFAAAPKPGPGTPVAPEPKPADPPRKPDTPDPDPKLGKKPPEVVEPKDPKKDMTEVKVEPGPKLGDPAKAPILDAVPVGKLDGTRVLIVSRAADEKAGWVRLDAADSPVVGSESVMALPGYKADVRLDGDVTVHLWGNFPEQVPARPLVVQSRCKFHVPDKGFDADITLEAGRVYVTTRKPTGAKVRLRVASQVWDVSVPQNTDVLVQMSAAFVPGTPYAREGGESPRVEARLVVLRGKAGFNPSGRFKSSDVPAGSEVAWDSKSNQVTEPRPVNKDELRPDRIPLFEAENGAAIQEALNYGVKDAPRDGVALRLKALLLLPPEADNFVRRTQVGAYGTAALAEGPDAPGRLRDLIDASRVVDEPRARIFVRRAVVSAVSAWIAAHKGNTALLVQALRDKDWNAADAETAAHLLRGYSSITSGDTQALSDLLRFLESSEHILVREAALGNLVSYYDFDFVRNAQLLTTDVARVKEADYARQMKSWREWAEETKLRMMMKK